jgi:hypothetical protein
MTDGEQEPDSDVEMDGVEAAEQRYDQASPENREAAWLELWHARDFTWQGRPEKAALQTEMVEVPASFPDGREAKGDFKTVSLKDYWRWSVGLPGEERLLTDEEMREAGLLVEVDGETYHLIHAPDMGLKVDEHGTPLQILKDIVAARGKRVPKDIGTDADGNPNFTRALQLRGGWLPGGLLRHAGSEGAIHMSDARVSDIDLRSMKVGPLNCLGSLFIGKATFEKANFSGEAIFGGATFSGEAYFRSATFKGIANFSSTVFKSATDFVTTTFEAESYFNASSFGEVNFRHAVFQNRAAFRGAWLGNAGFPWTKFQDVAAFDNASFGSGLNFFTTRFSGRAYFGRIDIQPDVEQINFKSAAFEQGASFHEVKFPADAQFERAHFGGDAGFGKTLFRKNANFKAASFNGKTSFLESTFEQDVSFEKASFEKETSFEQVDWPMRALDNAFRSSRFRDRADFSSHRFQSVSAFNEARFDIEPIFPDPKQRSLEDIFRAAIFQTNQAIEHDIKAQARTKKTGPLARSIKDQRLEALEGGFRTLKRISERKGDFLLSQAYYRFEIRARVKRPAIPFWEKLAAATYGLSSDYGNSIGRPFVSLAVILAGFAAIYLALAIEVNLVDWQDRESLRSGFFESLDFSLKNVFRPLSALSTDAPREGDASSVAGKLLNNYGKGFGLIVTAISIVQSLTGIVLAFLFGLAVRRRFQIS